MTISNPPPGKRSVPGIPAKQLWDANSFRTPNYFFFPWHWLGSFSGIVSLLAAGATLVWLWGVMH